jgi:hypothetical protein
LTSTVLEPVTTVSPLPPGCQALIWPYTRSCGEPGFPALRGCVHEHVRDGIICGEHAKTATCRDCYLADGHHCPISVMPISAVTS